MSTKPRKRFVSFGDKFFYIDLTSKMSLYIDEFNILKPCLLK